MAMTIEQPDADEDALQSTINTTPLVDVMLVLLIIFLITVPVVTRTVHLALPKETNVPTQTKPEDIVISVNEAGDIYWGVYRTTDLKTLAGWLAVTARKQPQPEVHIRGDLAGRYDSIGKVVDLCQQAGIAHVGFLTEPPVAQVVN
jgi:biopolymer transport protein ExbD